MSRVLALFLSFSLLHVHDCECFRSLRFERVDAHVSRCLRTKSFTLLPSTPNRLIQRSAPQEHGYSHLHLECHQSLLCSLSPCSHNMPGLVNVSGRYAVSELTAMFPAASGWSLFSPFSAMCRLCRPLVGPMHATALFFGRRDVLTRSAPSLLTSMLSLPFINVSLCSAQAGWRPGFPLLADDRRLA